MTNNLKIMLLVVALGGCTTGEGVVLVVVSADSGAPVFDVASFHVTATAAGRSGRPVDFALPNGPRSLPPEITFGIGVPPSLSGAFTVTVEAHNAQSMLVGMGSGSTNVTPGRSARADVSLGPTTNVSSDLTSTDEGALDMADASLTDTGCPPGFVDSGTSCIWDDPSLTSIGLSPGTLVPAFSPTVTTYKIYLPIGQQDVSITPTVLRPSDATIQVDSSISASGTPVQKSMPTLGEHTVTIVVTAASGSQRTYSLLLERGISFDTYFKASNTGPNDNFGAAVAIAGDLLAVGAPRQGGSGAVYVFTRSAGAWSETAILKASNAEANDGFGSSVAISGTTILVGAPSEDSNGTGVDPANKQADDSAADSGAAYVFVRNGTSWTQQAYLKASNTASMDDFGASVAIVGDTAVVGADLNGGSGSVYVFNRSGMTWSGPTVLKASNAESGDGFGSSISMAAGAIVVGAYGEDSNGTGVNSSSQTNNSLTNSGAAYVFGGSGTSWGQTLYIKASNPDPNDNFGYSVAINALADTIVVGATGESSNGLGVNPSTQSDNSKSLSGAAYLFGLHGAGGWVQEAYFKATNPDPADQFGWPVAIDGDVIVVGAQAESGSGSLINSALSGSNSLAQSGAAYFFYRSAASTWSELAYLKALNPQMGALNGIVAISGNTIVSGSVGEHSSSTGINSTPNSSFTQAGAVYSFVVQP